MPTQEQLDKITEKHGGTPDGRRRGRPPKTKEVEKPKLDLDDPNDQDRILNPLPRTFKLRDGYSMTLNEPSLRDRRRIFGFASRVIADACSLPGINKGLLPIRTISLLNSREDLETEMFFWCAKLFGPPGQVTDEQANEFANEIADNASPKDALPIFEALCTIAGADFSK